MLYLDYAQNTLTFEFSALQLSHPESVSYEYFLEGYDKNWIQSGNATYIRYSKIPPGSYTFNVRAITRNNSDHLKTTRLQLLIARPFWMKSWFVFVVLLVFLGIVTLIIYYLSTIRIRRKLAELERLEEIGRIRRRISSDLHDDIGSGLSKLAMLSDTSMVKTGNSPEVRENLQKISKRARNLIDQLRVIVWTLNPQFDQLENLVAYIRQQAGDFLENSNIRLYFDLPESIPAITITPDVKRNVHSIVMESLNNAIKHSGTQEVTLKVRIDGNHLEMAVSDSGKGFDTHKISGFGNGLHFMQKRMEDIHGRLLIKSETGSGTTILLSVDL